MSCYQYDLRVQNLDDDLLDSGLLDEEVSTLKVSDFECEYVPADDKEGCAEVVDFIKRHEWLQKMPAQPTHRFVARHRDTYSLAGAIVMATPNSFSHLLGKENRDLEKLISRGACISWSPKGLASHLLMSSIRWMITNTTFRVFTAYSDTEAGELGTIYQATNFQYLGRTSGSSFVYFDEKNPNKGEFSDRQFRKLGAYKRYAKELGIKWSNSWNIKDAIQWDKVPPQVQMLLRKASRDHQDSCVMRQVSAKHKYVYIRGQTKKETRALQDIFDRLNPDKMDLPYPKIRGE